jgi:drug/metabolite transporter (DMT)-like permease
MSGRVVAAYLIVCLVWGSTYLAIRIGVGHMPPALFGGIRFLTAGLLLLGIATALGRRLPRRREDWFTAAIVGTLLLVVGNGLVIWAEQFVESGTAAILVVTGALWMGVFDTIIPGSQARPTWRQFIGLLVGFAGTALLVGGVEDLRSAGIMPVAALLIASASWALGSVYSKRRPVETGPYVHAALQMIVGGVVMLVVGVAFGEVGRFELDRTGLAAIAYLVVFGSIVGYTSYVYLLRHAQPAFVGTHGYINTVVAVLLGWWLLGENVTVTTFVAMAIIIGAIVWVRQAETERTTRGS